MPTILTEEQREKARARAAGSYRRNRDRVLARSRENYSEHREEKSDYNSRRYRNHKGSIDARNAAYRSSHLEKIAALSKAWQKKNPNRVAAAKHKWYLKFKERDKPKKQEYQRQHPEIFIAHAQRRRALKRFAAINLTAIQEWMRRVKMASTAVCYYCQSKVSSKEIHFDHIIALSKGGAHSVENLCVSCAPCNLSKHNKAVGAWIRVGQQVLSL